MGGVRWYQSHVHDFSVPADSMAIWRSERVMKNACHFFERSTESRAHVENVSRGGCSAAQLGINFEFADVTG